MKKYLLYISVFILNLIFLYELYRTVYSSINALYEASESAEYLIDLAIAARLFMIIKSIVIIGFAMIINYISLRRLGLDRNILTLWGAQFIFYAFYTGLLFIRYQLIIEKLRYK